MSDEQNSEQGYVAAITSDVMSVLSGTGLFDALDEVLCPVDESKPAVVCRSDYEVSRRILVGLGFKADDLEDIFNVLRSRGGCCDCEILYNVIETSRLKSKYWRAQADRHGRERRGE